MKTETKLKPYPKVPRVLTKELPDADIDKEEVMREIEKDCVVEKSWCDHYEALMREGAVGRDDIYFAYLAKDVLPAGYVSRKLSRLKKLRGEWADMVRDYGFPADYDKVEKTLDLIRRKLGISPADWKVWGKSVWLSTQRMRRREEREKREAEREESVKIREEIIEETEKSVPVIDEELERVFMEDSQMREVCDFREDYTSIFNIRPLNDKLRESAQRPDPVSLWKNLWIEGELCCLFADTNVGKSIYAMQIAAEIAKSRKIVVFDFEMVDKQIEKRSRDTQRRLHAYPENLMHTGLEAGKLGDTPLEDVIVRAIEQAVTRHKIDTFIIDNIGWLVTNTSDGEIASKLMKSLFDLRMRRGFSILVIGHTNKRDLKMPLTQNDLSGSKKLMNFFDAAFCINKSNSDGAVRYIKQIKTRNGAFEYDADHVLTCEITDEDGWVHFRERGFATEEQMLRDATEKEEQTRRERVVRYREEGMSYREIASRVGVSLAKVQRILAAKQDS